MSQQLELFPVSSPCRGICQSNDRGYCLGCMRSRDERFHWGKMSDAQKREVLRLCRQRFVRFRRAVSAENSEEPPQPELF
ncbi:MAG: DUF1289 domain-containing protein [Enterobacteriaceae bacterium]